MALTLTTNPAGTNPIALFAGFRPVEFVFKREDLAITSVESGSGGVKINVTTDLTSYLSVGDSLYLYSAGVNYTYDAVGTILSLTASDITIDLPYIENATGGYINYLKNYYVEMQLVDADFNDSLIVPFSLEADGDAAGNIVIDVSVANDLNLQRGIIASRNISESTQQFAVKYRQVYEGSSESFTVIADCLIVLVYATEQPAEEEILNSFDLPEIYLGYPGAVAICKTADPASSTLQMTYSELDQNQTSIASGVLDELDSDVNGFFIWEWPSDASIDDATKYIKFDLIFNTIADYDKNDYESTDYFTD